MHLDKVEVTMELEHLADAQKQQA